MIWKGQGTLTVDKVKFYFQIWNFNFGGGGVRGCYQFRGKGMNLYTHTCSAQLGLHDKVQSIKGQCVFCKIIYVIQPLVVGKVIGLNLSPKQHYKKRH